MPISACVKPEESGGFCQTTIAAQKLDSMGLSRRISAAAR
jgi:hypothetical protein